MHCRCSYTTSLWLHTHTCTHTHTHTYTHTHTHTHTGQRPWPSALSSSPSKHCCKQQNLMTLRMLWWPDSIKRTLNCIGKLPDTGYKSTLVVSSLPTFPFHVPPHSCFLLLHLNNLSLSLLSISCSLQWTTLEFLSIIVLLGSFHSILSSTSPLPSLLFLPSSFRLLLSLLPYSFHPLFLSVLLLFLYCLHCILSFNLLQHQRILKLTMSLKINFNNYWLWEFQRYEPWSYNSFTWAGSGGVCTQLQYRPVVHTNFWTVLKIEHLVTFWSNSGFSLRSCFDLLFLVIVLGLAAVQQACMSWAWIHNMSTWCHSQDKSSWAFPTLLLAFIIVKANQTVKTE